MLYICTGEEGGCVCICKTDKLYILYMNMPILFYTMFKDKYFVEVLPF